MQIANAWIISFHNDYILPYEEIYAEPKFHYSHSPSQERVKNVTDGSPNTKYLNFKGAKGNWSGFRMYSENRLVDTIKLQAANDHWKYPKRFPINMNYTDLIVLKKIDKCSDKKITNVESKNNIIGVDLVNVKIRIIMNPNQTGPCINKQSECERLQGFHWYEAPTKTYTESQENL